MTAYTTAVLADSPLYYYTLNEAAGNSINQGSGGVVPLRTGSGVTRSATGATSILGNAWTYDGTTNGYSYLDPADGFDLTAQSAITVEAWVSVPSFGGSNGILCEMSTNSNLNAGTMHIDMQPGDNTIHLTVIALPGGVTKYWADKYTPPSAATFHHYVYVLDRATPVEVVYVDGVSQSLTSIEHDAVSYGNFSAQAMFFMARNFGGSLQLNATVQHFAIYPGTLSSGRVTAHYTAASTPAPVANFTGTPTTTTSGGSVIFTDSSTNTPTSWLWEKNSGSGWVNFAGSPTSQNPTETFS